MPKLAQLDVAKQRVKATKEQAELARVKAELAAMKEQAKKQPNSFIPSGDGSKATPAPKPTAAPKPAAAPKAAPKPNPLSDKEKLKLSERAKRAKLQAEEEEVEQLAAAEAEKAKSRFETASNFKNAHLVDVLKEGVVVKLDYGNARAAARPFKPAAHTESSAVTPWRLPLLRPFLSARRP